MKFSTRFACVSAVVAGLAPSAYAHPGHTHEIVSSASGWHYVLQPEHGLSALALAAGLASLLVFGLRKRRLAKLALIPIRRHR